MRKLVSFFLPGGLLLAAAAIFVHSGLMSPWLPVICRVYPHVVFGLALFLGWRFNRNRLVYGAAVIYLSERVLAWLAAGATGPAMPFASVAAGAVNMLLPLNLLVFSLLKKHGIISLRALIYFFLIALQPAAVVLCHQYRPELIPAWMGVVFYPSPVSLPLPQPVMAAFILSSVIMAACFFRDRDVMKQGFFWAATAAFAALALQKPGIRSTLYLSTAGLILVVSAIEAVYSMAYQDELTRLPARRALNETLTNLRGRYSVAMIDIDHFKKFNDRFGHDVGDQVLGMVAAKLGGVTGGGRAFRYGGEEFTIVFPGKSKDKTLTHLEKLRKTIAGADFNIRGKNRPKKKPEGKRKPSGSTRNVSVTVSIGVAHRIDKSATPGEIVKMADKALYKAKKGGRNRVEG